MKNGEVKYHRISGKSRCLGARLILRGVRVVCLFVKDRNETLRRNKEELKRS